MSGCVFTWGCRGSACNGCVYQSDVRVIQAIPCVKVPFSILEITQIQLKHWIHMDYKKTSGKVESSGVVWSLISNIATVIILCLEHNHFLALLVYDKQYNLYSCRIAIGKNSCCMIAYCIRKWNQTLLQYEWVPDERLVMIFLVK